MPRPPAAVTSHGRHTPTAGRLGGLRRAGLFQLCFLYDDYTKKYRVEKRIRCCAVSLPVLPFPSPLLASRLPSRFDTGWEGDRGRRKPRRGGREEEEDGEREGWRKRGREGRGTILIRAHLNAAPSRSPTTLAFIIPRYHSVRRWLGTSGGASRSRGGRPGCWASQVTPPLSCIVHRRQVSSAPEAVSRCMMPPGHCSLDHRRATQRWPTPWASGLSCGLSRR